MQMIIGPGVENTYNLCALYRKNGWAVAFAIKIVNEGRYDANVTIKAKRATYNEFAKAFSEVCAQRLKANCVDAAPLAADKMREQFNEFMKQQFNPEGSENIDPNAPGDEEAYKIAQENIHKMIRNMMASIVPCACE